MNNVFFKVYKDQVKEWLGVDDKTITALDIEVERNPNLSLVLKHPFLFHSILGILSNIIFPLMGLKRKVKVSSEDFILVSCPDPVFRTKNIGLISDNLKYIIIEQPNFHIKEAIQYNKYFKAHGIDVFFPTIRIKHIIEARKKIKAFICKNNIIKNKDNNRTIIGILSVFLIYHFVVNDYLKRCKEFSGKWIIEHQIFYFIPVISGLHSEKKEVTMLQHGIFFKPTDDYFPVNCDKVLCCSDREKKIYTSEGVPEEKISVLGIPLQTLSNHQINMNQKIEYGLLILLPMMNEVNTPLIQSILNYIHERYESVLLRFRPRSRDNDMQLLGNVVNGFNISEVGVTISQDLVRCRRVITFSADAIVEVVKVRRPFVYIWLKEYRDFVKDLQCATMDNYKEYIDSLMKIESFTNKIQEMSIDIIGEQDVEIIRSRFVEYVKS